MARHENENIEHLNLPETDDIFTEFIDKSGNSAEEQNAVAKIVKVSNKEQNRTIYNYYIKHGRGMLFDPYGIDANKINSYNFQFKKVNPEIYSQYLQYLKTRKSIYLTYAQREFKDGDN